MSETKPKKPRIAEITDEGTLALVGKGRPSKKKKYRPVTQDELQCLLNGDSVEA